MGKLFVAGIITDHAGFHRPRDHQGRILNVHEPTEFHGPRDEAGAGRLLGVAEGRAPIGCVAEELKTHRDLVQNQILNIKHTLFKILHMRNIQFGFYIFIIKYRYGPPLFRSKLELINLPERFACHVVNL